ncbi:O-antigen translocase [Enterobacter cancerogenus]|uniref:O-antigen translocase n=1 Tax=Enterobacter cancerogenus TaxID=69218 RepID=UPI0028B54191|nr:O-antigen translocase [Enterobacter cancerogenus]MDT7008630.1 O-antigen translocase [Enterobacter cancerogenus]WNN58335.1 O-antigen translocase [Enterobacter cancerogenus]
MKRLLAVTSLTGLLTLLKIGAGFLVGKVVAIYVGPSGLAMLGQIQNIVSLFNGLVNSPAGAGVVRYTAQNYKDENFTACVPWWRASMFWIMCIAFVLITLTLVFSKDLSRILFTDDSYSRIIVVTALVLPLTAIGTLINSVNNGQQNYKRFVLVSMFSVILSTGVMTFLIIRYHIMGGLLAVALQYGLIGLVSLIFCIKLPWVRLTFWFGKTSKQNIKNIFSYMLMAVTSAMCLPISMIIIRKLLVNNVGWDSAGQWQAVWKISEAYLGVVTLAMGTYFLPKLSTLTTYIQLKNEILNTAKIILPLVGLMGLSIYLLREFIVSILFTKDFKESLSFFHLQLLGDFIKISAWLFAYPLLSKGKVKWYMVTEILSALIFVGLSYVFIDWYGLKGVFYAYIANYLFYLLFILFNLKKILED